MIVNVTLQSVAYHMIVINNSKTFIIQATALVQPIYSENYLLSNSNNKTIHIITQHFSSNSYSFLYCMYICHLFLSNISMEQLSLCNTYISLERAAIKRWLEKIFMPKIMSINRLFLVWTSLKCSKINFLSNETNVLCCKLT